MKMTKRRPWRAACGGPRLFVVAVVLIAGAAGDCLAGAATARGAPVSLWSDAPRKPEGTTKDAAGDQQSGAMGERPVPLAKDGRPGVTIAYGKADAAVARRLGDQLSAVLGVDVPMVEDAQILAPGTWRPADQWRGKHLLMIGSIHTNRALLPLHVRFLAGASASYPGPGRYEIRVVFEPFCRGASVIVVGASDGAGLEAGVNRFLGLVRILAERGNPSMPPLVELGSASGPDQPAASVAGALADLADAVYWDGSLAAARKARGMVLKDLETRQRGFAAGPYENYLLDGAHYKWVSAYRALRQLTAVGIFSDEELRRIDERLVQNGLETADGYGRSAVTRDPAFINRYLSRHMLTGLLGQLIIFEYLDQVGYVPRDKQAAIHRGYEQLRSHVDALLKLKRFRSCLEGYEGLDCVNLLTEVYLHSGDDRLVQDGILRSMADYYLANVDNLGYQAGTDAYITTAAGSHAMQPTGGLSLLAAACLLRDGQYRWLTERMNGFRFTYSYGSRIPPGLLSLGGDVAAVAPSRYTGLGLVSMDRWAYQTVRELSASEALTPVEAPYTDVFSKAVFRDGFGSEDAYLMLQGLSTHVQYPNHEAYQANSIPRYTELGSLLLYHNTQRQSSWARNAVSTSRGEHDPQSAACVLQGRFSSPVVSGVQSLLAHDGGVGWQRCIFRRHGGYFVVLDRMAAAAADMYHFTCRWRSFHAGQLKDRRTFAALDGMTGTSLQIVPSEPVAQSAAIEPGDGAAEPTILRQTKTAHLAAGEAASFQNLLYATNSAVGRDFDIRRLADQAVLVKGRSRDFAETAVLGTGTLAPLETASGECCLWYLSEHGLAASGVRRIALAGRLRAESPEGVDIVLLSGPRVGAISNRTAAATEIAFHCEPGLELKLDGRVIDARQRLRIEPGEHRFEVQGLAALLADAKAELERLWAARAPRKPPSPAAPLPQTGEGSQALAGADPWQEAWRYEGVPRSLREHRTLRASAEPATTIGTPAEWVDRRMPWRTPLAGWASGTEGTVILDLCGEVNIDSVRLIGQMKDFDAFRQSGASIEVVLSNDNFAADTRKIAIPLPRFEVRYAERLQRAFVWQFPSWVLPVGQQARYVKIVTRWPGRKEPLTFGEVEVLAAERAQRTPAVCLAREFLGNGRSGLLVSSGRTLIMLAPDGKPLWQRDLESGVVNLATADVDSDGKPEVLTFTLADKLHVYNADGSVRFVHNTRQGKVWEGKPEGGGHIERRPYAIGAWRPDEKGRLEYYFFPHILYGRIGPEPGLKQSVFAGPGGKCGVLVPDVTGDGREELAIIGRWAMMLSVLDSRSDLERGQLKYLASHPLTGYSSGNTQFPMYHDGAVVRSAEGRWLGMVAVNPGGVDYVTAPEFSPGWNHFNHAENTCFAVHDLSGDGVSELLLGRDDGFVAQYAIADGKMLGKVFAGGRVRALAAGGAQVAVATDAGLALVDRRLQVLGFRPGAVQSLGMLEASAGGIQRLAAALEDGTIVGLRPR